MTFALYLTSITDAISQISISGVTVKDYDEIATSYVSQPHVLLPNPEAGGWITNFTIEPDTLLEGADAMYTAGYTLNYRYLHVQIGDGANFQKNYAETAQKMVLIVNAIIANPGPYSGKVSMRFAGADIGQKNDPAGNNYFGADFALNIEELQN